MNALRDALVSAAAAAALFAPFGVGLAVLEATGAPIAALAAGTGSVMAGGWWIERWS